MGVFFFLVHIICTGWQAFLLLIGRGNLINRKLAERAGSPGSSAGEQREDGLCPICQETLRESVRTDCGHLFCRACLVQHAKTSTSQLCCPTCRKPCSESVLGTGYVCRSHQKRGHYFCEECGLLLCEECEKCHRVLAVEKAMLHYKERLNRTIKKFRKTIRKVEHRALKEKNGKMQAMQVHCSTHRLGTELKGQNQARRQLEDRLQQQQDQPEDISEAVPRTLDIAKSIITDMEKTVKELDASKLKEAKELLHRSATIYLKLEKKRK